MTEEKKAIVRDLGFGGLMHIPPLRVDHQLLRELANNFKLGENKLRTGYGSFHITPKKIGDALGINATGDLFPEKVDYKKLSESDKIIYRRFQGKTLKSLTDDMMEIGVGNEEERLMFKRIFILYIQMAFLLPTTINKISPVHLVPIFEMEGIEDRNWVGVPIQFFVPPSQQTTTDADSEPTPMLQIEGARETTPETPKQHQETTPKLPPAPTKIHPDAEEAAALLMMARTASYVPKTDLPMPSFSLGLTDSSQEGAST
ncbi:uncharacterized protein LOC127742867 [Arachis duranensis]|uniref:Uncharacterized protein LOC127742867 n=1 Tax=Arachis duranensis TaxID=130453 RepID=A0A9C6T7U5_ARADU|nr:uncharacterized protein LOC127742867 [Arachis duranensis]